MKIYTYYEDINFKLQNELLDLWQTSWYNAEMKPIILGRSDAEKHPYYPEFIARLEDQHIKITNKKPEQYIFSCWLRWMAYTSVKEEYFYVSDYDIINVSKMKLKEPDTGYIHLLDDCCPCFATGSPKLFDRLIFDFVNITDTRLQDIKRHNEDPCYHDQNFFVCNRQYIINNLSDYIKLKRDRTFISPPFDNYKNKSPAPIIHFSHQACCTEENRIQMIKEFLNND